MMYLVRHLVLANIQNLEKYCWFDTKELLLTANLSIT
jgi:hypothetical protein